MSWTWLSRSLRAKLLTAVVVCALVPLAAVGVWLSTSAVRSGELLLRTQLDSAASRAAGVVRQRWTVRKSDLLMLATSAPVREAFAAPGADTAPAYARRAFATMTGISQVAARDKANHVRWALGDSSSVTPALVDPRHDHAAPNDEFMVLQ